ncbi:protein BEAN1 isoform X8 [Neophocaena asiaeorientalis asiaeorientalis]|uniref:Protein BEAN1 isoform X8 n=1 Tax=Neophocaena asiaeorientalis asiaeorientalis TaxID=1706337 RepID=A0A341AES9_NEOAA|nr:protein BEAN1 isoform X8 [Neophocaena asiaeorientalis asiaeorientalis]
MSRPRPPGPEEDALETLLDDLISYYLDRAGEGRLRVCRQAALTCRAQQLLVTGVPPQLYLPEDVAPDLGTTHSQGAPSSAQHICHKLVRALEFLELISINLLLFPWRKEIRSLKTYTGNFVYWVRPVLSEHTLQTILGRLGYMATSEAEFSLVQASSEEDTKQMVFEIFLTRVMCEAVLGTSGRQLLGPGREKADGPHCRPSSVRGLLKTHKGLQEAQSSRGPPAGARTERALAESPDGQRSLPVVFSLPEISIAPGSPLTGPPVSLGPQRRASTRSDSEEFLTCYSDLVLHQTPLFPRDHPLSSLKGKQLQSPGLGPSPPPGEATAPAGSSSEQPLVPSAAPERKGVTIPGQLCLVPGPQLSENSLDPKPEAQLEVAAPGTKAAPPNASSEMDELCEYLAHLLRPPTPAGHPGGSPGPGVEENGQSEPLMRPEPAGEGGSPDGTITQFWRSPQAPSHVQEPPSAHYVPPEGMEVPAATRGYYTSNRLFKTNREALCTGKREALASHPSVHPSFLPPTHADYSAQHTAVDTQAVLPIYWKAEPKRPEPLD